MLEKDSELLNAIIRSNFNAFMHKAFYEINPGIKYCPNWHIDIIGDYLAEVRKGNIKRLIINMPPRSLKSVVVSVAWPAWVLGLDPTKRIMAASYSQNLSEKHSIDCKQIIQSDWHKLAFPSCNISKLKNTKSKYMTTQNGFRLATSVKGSATGEGGDFLIIDDPHKPSEINSKSARHKVIDWYEQTFSTRLNDKRTGGIVIVMQRLHSDDLCGYLLESASNLWTHLKLPMIADQDYNYNVGETTYSYLKGSVLNPKRECPEALVRLEEEIGVKNFQSQYQQDPISQLGQLLPKDKITLYSDLPKKYDYIVQSWDTAIKVNTESDFSVCTTWAVIGEFYYLLHVKRAKLEYPELKKAIYGLKGKYNPEIILIEDKASGQSLIQDLRQESVSNIIPIKPKLDKITRFSSIIELFETGRVKIQSNKTWSEVTIKELTEFPSSRNDDIVDSISQFLNFIKSYKSQLSNLRLRFN